MQNFIDMSGKVVVMQVSGTGARCKAEMRVSMHVNPVRSSILSIQRLEKSPEMGDMVVAARKSAKRNLRCLSSLEIVVSTSLDAMR